MFERSQPEKTKTVTLRITDEERLAIMLKCEEKGVSISDLLREAMRRFLTQDNLPID